MDTFTDSVARSGTLMACAVPCRGPRPSVPPARRLGYESYVCIRVREGDVGSGSDKDFDSRFWEVGTMRPLHARISAGGPSRLDRGRGGACRFTRLRVGTVALLWASSFTVLWCAHIVTYARRSVASAVATAAPSGGDVPPPPPGRSWATSGTRPPTSMATSRP